MVSAFASASAANTNISLSIAVHTCLGGLMLSASTLASSISCLSFLVEFVPCRVRTMWPRAVAVAGGRCFLISSMVSPGHDFNCSFRMALINVDTVGEQRH